MARDLSSLLSPVPMGSPQEFPAFHPKHRIHWHVILQAVISHPETTGLLLALFLKTGCDSVTHNLNF